MNRHSAFTRASARSDTTRRSHRMLTLICLALLTAGPWHADAQTTGAPLPTVPRPVNADVRRIVYDAAELDRIVSPIALYPDPLLAQLLNAATFPREIPFAAQWVERRRGLSGEQLADALSLDRVTWDPSVQSLIAFPTVLQMMASAMPWTEELGDAFLNQHEDVMDAVQRMRQQAQRYGYLRSNSQWQVTSAPIIEILPVNPAYVVVPYYDPYVVFAPPRPRFVVSSAIYFGFGVRLGVWYEPWGWRQSGFDWVTSRVVYGYPGWNRPRDYRFVNARSYRFEPRRIPRDDGRRVGNNDRPSDRFAIPRDAEPRRGDDGRDNNGRAVNGGPGNSGYRNGNSGNVRDTERELRRDAPRDAQRGGGRDVVPVQVQVPERGGREFPQQEERRSAQPRFNEPRQNDPRASDPRQSAPRQSEPRQSEPRQSAPRQSEPRQSEPRQSEPRQESAPRERTAQPRGGRAIPRGGPPAEASGPSR